MPPRAKRPCRQQLCPGKTTARHGYCDLHASLASGWNRPGRATAEQRGYDWKWRKLARQVLERDMHLCQCEDCKGERLPATEVDHIVPKSAGGTDEPGNLQAINRDCHARKTRREARRAAALEVAPH